MEQPTTAEKESDGEEKTPKKEKKEKEKEKKRKDAPDSEKKEKSAKKEKKAKLMGKKKEAAMRPTDPTTKSPEAGMKMERKTKSKDLMKDFLQMISPSK